MKSLVARMSISSKTGITVDFGHKGSRMHIYMDGHDAKLNR